MKKTSIKVPVKNDSTLRISMPEEKFGLALLGSLERKNILSPKDNQSIADQGAKPIII